MSLNLYSTWSKTDLSLYFLFCTIRSDVHDDWFIVVSVSEVLLSVILLHKYCPLSTSRDSDVSIKRPLSSQELFLIDIWSMFAPGLSERVFVQMVGGRDWEQEDLVMIEGRIYTWLSDSRHNCHCVLGDCITSVPQRYANLDQLLSNSNSLRII